MTEADGGVAMVFKEVSEKWHGRSVEALKSGGRTCGEGIIMTGLRRMLVRRGSCDGPVVGSNAGRGGAMRRGPCDQNAGKALYRGLP